MKQKQQKLVLKLVLVLPEWKNGRRKSVFAHYRDLWNKTYIYVFVPIEVAVYTVVLGAWPLVFNHDK